MRFTLKLCDYLEQYAENLRKNNIFCPVCYEKILTHDQAQDVDHILMCYKMQLIELELEKYYNLYGDFPEMSEEFIHGIAHRVESEVETLMLADVSSNER